MKRREFMIKSAITGSGLMAFSNTSAFNPGNSMEYSVLGRTGAKVSRMGIGCASFRDSESLSEVKNVVSKAIDDGITYFDTAPNYGTSEERLGKALKGKRDNVFLVSKTEDATYDGTWKLLKQSLRRLQTDYIDLIHVHNFGRERRFPDLDAVFSDDGAMGALREAKEKGVIRFIGTSGHVYPSRFHRAIDSGEMDVFMVAVNYILQHTYDFEHKIWLRALSKNIGMVSMKVLGGSLRPEKNHRIPAEDYEMAIRYTKTLKGLSTAVIGLQNMEEYTKAFQTFIRAQPLNEEEYLKLSRRGLDLLKNNKKWRTAHGTPVT